MFARMTKAFNPIKGLAQRGMAWAGETASTAYGKGPAWMQKAGAGAQTMGRGYAADASKIWTGKYGTGGLKRAGHAISWPYRGSFERGALFTGGVAGGIGTFAGGRWLYNKLGERGRGAAAETYRNTSPKGRKVMQYVDRNF
jgi:hypothetical protein